MGSHKWKGSMRSCSLLLLPIFLIFGSTIGLDLALPVPKDQPVVVAVGSNLTEVTGLTGILDLLPSPNSPLPSRPCPTRFHCKRPSLKSRGKMICCLLVNTRGRLKCPNSC